MKDIFETVTFTHLLNNKADDAFTIKNTVDLDMTEKDEDQLAVSLVTHFIRFSETIGFPVEVILEVFDIVLESYMEFLEDEEEEEKDYDREMVQEEIKQSNISSFSSFEKDLMDSKDFRKYLFSIYKDEHSG